MANRVAMSIGLDTKPPNLFRGDYMQWTDIFLDFVSRRDLADSIMRSITEGPKVIMQTIPAIESATGEIVKEAKESVKEKSKYTSKGNAIAKGDLLCRSFILQGIMNDIYTSIDSYKHPGKAMWDQIEKIMMGSNVGNQMKMTNCITSYENFKAKEDEMLKDTYQRFVKNSK